MCQGDWIGERRGTAVCVGEDKPTVGKMLVVESTWPLELCRGLEFFILDAD